MEEEKIITTTCCWCGDIIILENKYGWTENDQGITGVICEFCENYDECL